MAMKKATIILTFQTQVGIEVNHEKERRHVEDFRRRWHVNQLDEQASGPHGIPFVFYPHRTNT